MVSAADEKAIVLILAAIVIAGLALYYVIPVIYGMLPRRRDLDDSAPPMPEWMKNGMGKGEYKHEYLGELVGVDSSGKPVFEKNGKVTGIEYGYGYKKTPDIEKMNLSSMPWKVNPCANGIYATVDDAKGENIACIDYGNMCVEDARMCAAAPEMYEDLQSACRMMCQYCKVSVEDRREVCDQCAVAGWLETLAKAAGHDKVEVK